MESTELVQEQVMQDMADARAYAGDVVIETLEDLSANEPLVQLEADVGEAGEVKVDPEDVA